MSAILEQQAKQVLLPPFPAHFAGQARGPDGGIDLRLQGWQGGLGLLFEFLDGLPTEFPQEVIDLHAETGCALLNIDGPLELVGHLRDALHHTPHHLRSLDRVPRSLFLEQVNLEADEVQAVLVQPLDEGLFAEALGKRVGVFSVWQHGHLDIQPLSKDDVHAANGRAQSGGVPVEQHGHLLAEPAEQPHLLDGQGRPGTRHHVVDPGLAHGHDIGVALHQDGPVLPHDFIAREVNAVERP